MCCCWWGRRLSSRKPWIFWKKADQGIIIAEDIPMRSKFSYANIILILASLLGVAAFLSPFFGQPPARSGISATAHGNDAMLMLMLLSLMALAAVVAGLQSNEINAKTLAVLGALAAVGSILRFLPGPGGFSGVFFLPIVAGYAFGAQFGFLSGLVTLLASAFLTGSVGPWLPYQMFASGWVGAIAGLVPHVRPGTRWEIVILAGVGLLLGVFYGLIMNLWFWPYVFRPEQADLYWQPGQGPLAVIRSYALFYFITSFVWDLGRGVGNAAFILIFGMPVLRLLHRYQQRFHFAIMPANESVSGNATPASSG
jgi:energy-coupling factor transport system substrate-specific component